ncbi:odorant receptor Or2-like [Anoplophora glabripennis]|uniref:odorant receptor Or2-like n=1 Tax=Anoplophora glabripennis TaxID=217634 RepID=UPI000C77ABDB|nr:odorant receptor Or2-like [Anoplophora glabripennis]
MVGAFYMMYTDAYNFNLIIFPLGQIRILTHVLSNFPRYVLKVKDQLQCSRDEASFVTLRECILKHKGIIRYLEEYNDTMKNIMLLDFLQSSLQLASIMIQFVLTKATVFNIIFHAEFVFSMLLRLLVYYWYANEIMLESINVSTAIYECGWYDEPKKVKQMMLLMIQRANKVLKLDIGPFTTMTLGTFLSILKASYSYLTVMYR